ncbi:MAG: two-component system, LytTR family, sensor kinase, partial [Acidobacteriota bacterium]|nr:two-component system, LytTR family, sensor kinase [Acidobacteriota bacterium]
MRNRRLLLLSALAWLVAGTFVLLLEVATRAILHTEQLKPARIMWGWIGWCEWALLAPLLVLLTARFAWQRVSKPLFVAVHLVAPFVFTAVQSSVYFGMRILASGAPGDDPAQTLRQAWLQRLPIHLTIGFLVYGATVLATHVVLFFRAEWARERERLALERRIAQAELDIFKLQLQPEMVGEKLQVLEALIERDPAAAETLLSRFSTLLRQSLAAGDARRPLADEVAYANAFIAVERLLDPATPELEVALPADVAQALVPGACLTPIVHALLKVQRRSGDVVTRSCRLRADAPSPGALRFTLAVPFDISRDPELRDLVREIGSRLGEDERLLLQDANTIAYEGPLVLTPTAEEDETPLLREPEHGGGMPHRLSLPLKVLIVIGAVPGVLLVVNAFWVMAAMAGETPIAWRDLWTSFNANWFAWPVTLVMLLLGARLPIAARTWKRSVLVMALAAAAVPPLWDLGSQMLLYTVVEGHGSAWEATRAFLLSSSRTLDFLVFFGIALSALAYQRYLAWRQRAVDIGELDARLLRTRARLLRLQLNPHFLFNALNSIAALLEDDPAAARRMAAQLRHFVDRVLKTSDRQEVPLGEELDLLTTYVAIENVRFSDRLELDLRIE